MRMKDITKQAFVLVLGFLGSIMILQKKVEGYCRSDEETGKDVTLKCEYISELTPCLDCGYPPSGDCLICCSHCTQRGEHERLKFTGKTFVDMKSCKDLILSGCADCNNFDCGTCGIHPGFTLDTSNTTGKICHGSPSNENQNQYIVNAGDGLAVDLTIEEEAIGHDQSKSAAALKYNAMMHEPKSNLELNESKRDIPSRHRREAGDAAPSEDKPWYTWDNSWGYWIVTLIGFVAGLLTSQLSVSFVRWAYVSTHPIVCDEPQKLNKKVYDDIAPE